MQPFFLGPGQSLFGAYHPPVFEQALPETAVLFCNGLGADLMRSHRAAWSLAEQAAACNVHTLRFDYYATGDSHGEQAALDLQRCAEDIRIAAFELASRSGLANVRIVGLRFGAMAALLALSCCKDLNFVDRVVLWDPWVDGELEYRSLVAMHVEHTRSRNRYRRTEFQYAESDRSALLGFHYPPEFIRDISELKLGAMIDATTSPVAVLTSEPALDDFHWRTHLDPAKDVAVELPEPGGWHSVKTINQRLVMRNSDAILVDAMVSV